MRRSGAQRRPAPIRVRRLGPLGVFVAVWLLAAVALELAQHTPRLPLPRAAAIRAAADNARVRATLEGARWDSALTTAVDGRLERVTFLFHGRAVVEAAVQANGSVGHVIDFHQMPVPYGSRIAYEPALLVGLAALFVLMAGVAPWRRMRNLDVAATLWLVAPVLVLQQRFLGPSTLVAVPALVYLMARCASRALGPAPGPSSCTPLLVALTPALGSHERVRMLRLVALGLALVLLMVAVSSNGAVDVIYAVMEGATKLVHGILPYGHLPGDVVHGDTYPLLSYALYAPLAWARPVTSTWDSVDLALGLGAVFAALAGWAVFRGTAGRRDGAPRSPETEEAGLRAALAWLAFPALVVTVSTGTTDVGLAAMLALALLLWRRPGASTAVLAAAAWFKLAPAALLPLWLAPLRGRRLAAAVGAVAAVSAPMLALLLGLGGVHGAGAMVHAMAFQFSRDSPMSVWASPAAHRVQPLIQAVVLGLLAAAAVALRRRPDLAGDRARMAALAAAVLLGLELTADYWTFLYAAWVVPLLTLSLLHGVVAAPGRATDPAPASAPDAPAAALA